MDRQASNAAQESGYTVVARRYRPKTFQELIGQSHIAQALEKAIASGRVGHAYLFTGARGVGKTSTARIFAKALNVPGFVSSSSEGADVFGVAGEQALEIARAIDGGEDIDVIEIDGASNRGIDEIRQLRANVNVRPSRSRFKVYIIDEVHMLTGQAFNALLKTLEEPPPHVKFIFCTTDPDKIPITVLSRCQRYDFAPVKLEAIQARLKEIACAEGYQADDEALALLARRAAGSMRDSQSLLEQVMSFSTDRITVEQVHALLGTADESRLQALVEAMIARDPLQALELADAAIQSGADAGQLSEQLLGYLRDLLAVGIGGGPELMKIANPSGHPKLASMASIWGTQTLLSAMQILDEALVRMRSSVSATTLLEIALVQICHLESLASIPALLERIAGGGSASLSSEVDRPQSGQKKNDDSAAPVAPEAKSTPSVSAEAETEGAMREASYSNPAGLDVQNSRMLGPPPAVASPPTPVAAQASEEVAGTAPRDARREQLPYDDERHREPPAQQGSQRPQASAGHDLSQASSPGISARDSGSASVQRSQGSPQALAQWQRAVASFDGLLADYASVAVAVEPMGSEQWKVIFPAGAIQPKEYCEQPERRAELQAIVRESLGRDIMLQFAVLEGVPQKPAKPVSATALRAQKLREMSNHPYVKRLCEVLDGEIVRVDPAREPQLDRPPAGQPQASPAD